MESRKDRALEQLKQKVDALGKNFGINKINNLEQFQEVMKESLSESITSACRLKEKGGMTDDEILERVLKSQTEKQSKYSRLWQNFDKEKNAATQLKDILKQEAIADWKEKARFLLFRMLTAIGIAAIILCTAYISKCLNIPLPFARFPL